MMASSEPSRYSLGTTAKNNINATPPANPNPNKKVFLNLPWSAAPDMEIISRAWTRTLSEKVYMAKLAVLISRPRKYTMQAGSSSCPCFLFGILWAVVLKARFDGDGKAVRQGVVLSLSKTP
jgi:hypothetical protein